MPIAARAAHIPARAIEGFDIANTEFTNGDVVEVPKRTMLIIRFICVEVIGSCAIATEGDRLGSPAGIAVIQVEISNIHARGNTRRADSKPTIRIKVGVTRTIGDGERVVITRTQNERCRRNIGIRITVVTLMIGAT